MLVGQMGLMAVGIGCAFSPSLIAFACLRFTLALFLMASYVAAFVYGNKSLLQRILSLISWLPIYLCTIWIT